jgi:hypothetical protein
VPVEELTVVDVDVIVDISGVELCVTLVTLVVLAVAVVMEMIVPTALSNRCGMQPMTANCEIGMALNSVIAALGPVTLAMMLPSRRPMLTWELSTPAAEIARRS